MSRLGSEDGVLIGRGADGTHGHGYIQIVWIPGGAGVLFRLI